MEYEIEEEDLLLDDETSNPSLLRLSRQPGDVRRPVIHRKELDGADGQQMG